MAELTREERNKLDNGGGCSNCESMPGDIIIEVGDHYWLCESCARSELEQLHRAKAIIEMLTFYLLEGLPNCP